MLLVQSQDGKEFLCYVGIFINGRQLLGEFFGEIGELFAGLVEKMKDRWYYRQEEEEQ